MNNTKVKIFGALLLVLPITLTFFSTVNASAATPQLVWTKDFPNSPFTFSSPLPVRLADGTTNIVIGGTTPYQGSYTPSNVRLFKATDGSTVATLGIPANNFSIADVDNDNSDDIYIGAGGSINECQGDGGLYSISGWGGLRFGPKQYTDASQYVGTHCTTPSIFSSPVLGDINKDGNPDVTFGALGLKAWSANSQGDVNFGWPYYWDDTQSASPALADITGDGQPEVIFAGDSSPGGPVDFRGGMVRAFTGKGQQLWEFRTNEIIRSSPSVGDINGDNDIEIVFGTGNYWSQQPGGATDCSKVFALRRNGTQIWSKDIGAQVMTSPTLADFNGDGTLDVAVGGWRRPCSPPTNINDGRVWILNGATGEPLPGYPRSSGGQLIIGQIVSADINGDGGQDAVVPTANGVHVFDGKNGVELFNLSYGGDGLAFQNSPLIQDVDANGRLDIIIAGTKGDGSTGSIRRYEFPGGDVAALGSNGWHLNRKDKRQTGSWAASDLKDAPTGEKAKGYWLVASDGGVFPFGEAIGYGSTGNIRLNKPMVGMASTPSGNGYWLVAADGGIFPFGDAGGYGSTGNLTLRQPIVGMASTPSGNGYWLVAADGGIFPFGDAGGYGSTGNLTLRQPIVGMAATSNGGGYWLTAADGGIFPFGNAPSRGSAGNLTLVKPVVGMSAFPGNVYTMAASDGGTFSYGAINYGSFGGLPLNKPIVGLSQNGI